MTHPGGKLVPPSRRTWVLRVSHLRTLASMDTTSDEGKTAGPGDRRNRSREIRCQSAYKRGLHRCGSGPGRTGGSGRFRAAPHIREGRTDSAAPSYAFRSRRMRNLPGFTGSSRAQAGAAPLRASFGRSRAVSSGSPRRLDDPRSYQSYCLTKAFLEQTERRRSRTYPAWGYQT